MKRVHAATVADTGVVALVVATTIVSVIALAAGSTATLGQRAHDIALINAFGAPAIASVLLAFAAVRRHVTDRNRDAHIQRLRQAARIDALTLLGNHRAFCDDLEREIARAQRYGRPLTFALLDIDDFKTFNGAHGVERGDDALMRLGGIFMGLRSGDMTYRVGADEFAMLLVETDAIQANDALARLQRLIAQAGVGVSLSIGFAEFTADVTVQDLSHRAEAALYEARRRGRGGVVDYHSMGERAAIVSTQSTWSLRRLIDDPRALEIALQPIWNASQERLIGFEALARPETSLGFAGPQEAFALAERLHAGIELDAVCVQRALRAATSLERDEALFINLLATTLVHPDFDVDVWVDSVARAGIDPRRVVVEISERTIIHPEMLIRRTNDFKRRCVRLALDDTGAGFAGLTLLGAVAFDFVKIHRGLLLRAQTQAQARGVLNGILSIAQASGTRTIAQGIETVEHLDFVRHLHEDGESGVVAVDGLQGFLLGIPRTGAPGTLRLTGV